MSDMNQVFAAVTYNIALVLLFEESNMLFSCGHHIRNVSCRGEATLNYISGHHDDVHPHVEV